MVIFINKVKNKISGEDSVFERQKKSLDLFMADTDTRPAGPTPRRIRTSTARTPTCRRRRAFTNQRIMTARPTAAIPPIVKGRQSGKQPGQSDPDLRCVRLWAH